MQLHARLISRMASAGLGLVFVALIACALWATERIQLAADHAAAAVSLSDLYETANRDLDEQATLVRQHLLELNFAGWDEQRAASASTR